MKRYWLLRIELEQGDETVLTELYKIRDYFLGSMTPKNFDPFDSGNDIIKHDKEFEAMCSSMEEAGMNEAKNLTVFEFYSRIEYFEKKNKPKN